MISKPTHFGILLSFFTKPGLALSLLLIWTPIRLSAGNYDRKAIREAIELQMSSYPESTLLDIYKNFFQDAFGPGHLMGQGDDVRGRMRSYIEEECAVAEKDSVTGPYYERTGWHGRFYRVSLSVINDGKVSLDQFLDAFLESATLFALPEVCEWRKEWKAILRVLRRCGYDIPGFKDDKAAIDAILAQGQYASHHSEAYNNAYHPHYRLIEAGILESRLLPLLER